MAAPLLPEEHKGCLGFSLGGEVTLELFQDALKRFAGVLDALRESHDANVHWLVAELEHGSVSATVRAVPLDEATSPRIPTICDEYLNAAATIQGGVADLTNPLHRRMYDLLKLADDAHRLVIASDGRRIDFGTPIRLDKLEEPKQYITMGTLRGHVETLSRRNDLNFRLYELATGAAVVCHMDPDSEEVMRELWGHIADVTGTISREVATDKPLSIRSVTNVEPVEAGDAGGWRKARGVLRTDTPAEVLIRRLRDEG